VFCQRDRLGLTAGHHDTASGHHDGESGTCEQGGCGLEALRSTGRTLDRRWSQDLGVELAVEVVSRDVDLGRAAFEHRDCEGAMGQLGDPSRAAHVGLVFRDLREDRELIRFLEPRMAYFMVPRYVDIVARLPKTPTGKIQKYELRDLGVTTTTWDRDAAGIKLKR